MTYTVPEEHVAMVTMHENLLVKMAVKLQVMAAVMRCFLSLHLHFHSEFSHFVQLDHISAKKRQQQQ